MEYSKDFGGALRRDSASLPCVVCRRQLDVAAVLTPLRSRETNRSLRTSTNPPHSLPYRNSKTATTKMTAVAAPQQVAPPTATLDEEFDPILEEFNESAEQFRLYVEGHRRWKSLARFPLVVTEDEEDEAVPGLLQPQTSVVSELGAESESHSEDDSVCSSSSSGIGSSVSTTPTSEGAPGWKESAYGWKDPDDPQPSTPQRPAKTTTLNTTAPWSRKTESCAKESKKWKLRKPEALPASPKKQQKSVARPPDAVSSDCLKQQKSVARPPDAVSSDCLVLFRKQRKAIKKTPEAGEKVKKEEKPRRRSNSISRFFESFVRKVFDGQTHRTRRSTNPTPENASWNAHTSDAATTESNLLKVLETTPSPRVPVEKEYTPIKLQAPPPSKAALQKFDSVEASLRDPKVAQIAGKLANIPRFHFPHGKPIPRSENDSALRRVQQAFSALPSGTALKSGDLADVCKAMNVPLYWKRPLFDAIARAANHPHYTTFDDELPPITFNNFATFWREMTAKANDEASRFVFTLAAGDCNKFSSSNVRTYLVHDDFTAMIKDLIDTHPGLSFLADTPVFHRSYIDTVIARIFWTVNRSWTGRITAAELRKSNLLDTIREIEFTADINKITDFFSYEHFYVIYCKFWDLDQDHDMVISREDMRGYSGGGLTNRIIDRIFSGAVTRGFGARVGAPRQPLQTIGFSDFVAFILAEEDKRNPTSIEYWFRCLDLDGDGVISLYEMQYFYDDLEAKMLHAGYETMSFDDVVCNLLDLVSPAEPNRVTLRDLKKCGLAHRFINTFVNMNKYCEQESSEGERAYLQNEDREISDWDRFCAVEYELQISKDDYDDEEHDSENINIDLNEDDEE
uniref:EF-hand domain-containing protein n=1 Tax=Steinernema glaseri TaxID=37863 RepID=A0A1I8A060_9BILA